MAIGEERAALIKERLERAFTPTHLQVTDESEKHVGHAGYQGGGRHFAITIAATCFEGIPRVDAHRQIYSLFSDLIPERIHALRIKVVS